MGDRASLALLSPANDKRSEETAINTGASIHAQVSDAEWQARVDLAAACRLVAHFGWDDLVFTHTWARVPGEEDPFLISP
ncbi:MAG: hypothetical protein QM661_11360 [Solimonas sp.]